MAELSNIIDYMGTTYTVVIAILVVLFIIYVYKRPRNLPPGPNPLPLIGNLWKILSMKYPPNELMSLGERYGPVMSLKLGPRLLVILSNYDVICEAFVTRSQDTSGRPPVKRTGGKCSTGLIMEEGSQWKSLRRFSLSTLRDFGYGRNLIQEKILEEQHFVESVLNTAADGIIGDTRHLFVSATSNIICSLCFGHRFDYDDEKFKQVLHALDSIIRRFNFMNVAVILDKVIPILPSQRKRVKTAKSNVATLIGFIQDEVDNHKVHFDSSNLRDFVDVFLKVATDGQDQSFTEKNIFATIIDLFVAGTETTATTLSWAVLYMTVFPEVQARCQREIDEVVEGNRVLRIPDKKLLPYVEATLLEIHRCSATVPLGVPHRTTADTIIGGYHIPKDTMLMSNIFAAHHDKNKFEAPYNFRPERFLDNENRVINADSVLSFSRGPRMCLGEGLARSELFLFFSNLLNHFTFSKADDAMLDLTAVPKNATIREPLAYKVKATPRHG